jgi:hypothetical protein
MSGSPLRISSRLPEDYPGALSCASYIFISVSEMKRDFEEFSRFSPVCRLFSERVWGHQIKSNRTNGKRKGPPEGKMVAGQQRNM